MNKVNLLGAVFLLLPVLCIATDEMYLCIPDIATGFKYQNGEWGSVDFKMTNKYLIGEATKEFKATYKEAVLAVKYVGQKEQALKCEKGFEYVDLFCSGIFGRLEFHMNKDTLRYMYINSIGYLESREDQQSAGTPYMEIGKCSPI